MRALTKKDSDRKPSDLYRTPQALLDAWLTDVEPGYTGYMPIGWTGNPEGYLVCDPTCGDGRWGLSVAKKLFCDCLLTDIHMGTEFDVLRWHRPAFTGKVIVTSNPPFSLLDSGSRRKKGPGFVERVWGQLKDGDELVFLTTTVSHANYTRPVLYYNLGIMPYRDIWSIRWRSPMEDSDGVSLGGAAVDYQIVRAVKGSRVEPGETRQKDVLLPKQWKKIREFEEAPF